MANFLSPEEQFSDHLEIVSYLTIIGAIVFWLVYFGMIFFYAPVQSETLSIKLLTLVGDAVLVGLGFILLYRKNPARVLFRWIFLGFAFYFYDHSLGQQQWWYSLGLIFSVYSLWVLTHPIAIGFFRKTRPWEERANLQGVWFGWHLAILQVAALVLVWQGSQTLMIPEDELMSDPFRGVLKWTLGLALASLIYYTRRLHRWARYSSALLLGLIMLAGLLESLLGRTRHDLAFWKNLAWISYCGIASMMLFFSPGLNRIFKKPPAPGVDPA